MNIPPATRRWYVRRAGRPTYMILLIDIVMACVILDPNAIGIRFQDNRLGLRPGISVTRHPYAKIIHWRDITEILKQVRDDKLGIISMKDNDIRDKHYLIPIRELSL